MAFQSGPSKEVSEPQRAVVDTGHAQANELAAGNKMAHESFLTEKNNFNMAMLAQTDRAFGGDGKGAKVRVETPESLEVPPIQTVLAAQKGQPDAAARKAADDNFDAMVA